MNQNAIRESWSNEEIEEKLRSIMENIFDFIYQTTIKYGIKVNDLLTSFEKIAKAILMQGI